MTSVRVLAADGNASIYIVQVGDEHSMLRRKAGTIIVQVGDEHSMLQIATLISIVPFQVGHSCAAL